VSSEATSPEHKTEFVQSLARGLDVISAFSKDSPAMTLTEVSEATGLTRATARRFLMTLETLGFIQSTGNEFSLTPKVLELGFSYLSSLGLTELLSPHLVSLSDRVHESASAAILDGSDIVYIARAAGRKIMQVQITIGTRFPAVITSMGRVLLADLPTTEQHNIVAAPEVSARTPHTKTSTEELLAELAHVKKQGYSFVDQELELGLRSLAVPIRNVSGTTVAAINVSTTASASASSTLENLLAPLQECARQIEKSHLRF
jgi:IclR family pca regulon transcriptional regulator